MDREARKRKILARGADRMALITGRIQNLDPDPYSNSSLSIDPQPTQEDQLSSEPSSRNDQTLIRDYNHVSEIEVVEDEKLPKEVVPPVRVPDIQNHEKKETSQNYTIGPKRQFNKFLHSISPRAITQSITSTENTRVICSIAIAFFVVILTLLNRSHNVVEPKSFFAFRPLFLVLFTDILLLAMAAKLFQKKVGVKVSEFDEDGDNWMGAIKLMELGLVLFKVVRSIFVDCSVYLVIVVCGLSLF